MQAKLFIDGVNYYQFAAIVEDEIITQDFSASGSQPVILASRRSFTPSESANRLEIGVNRNFIHPITLDCRPLSNDRLMITATCIQLHYQPIFQKLLSEIRRYWAIPEPVPPAPSSAPSPPSPKPPGDRPQREINLGTAQRVAEAKYRILVDKITVGTACELADVNVKTFRRWKDNEVVERILQEMLEHPPEEL
jgi:hypothetical protein